jgi:peroxiredoxin
MNRLPLTTTTTLLWFAVAIGFADQPGTAPPSKFNKVVRVGEPAPQWDKLPGIDRRDHSLDEFHKAKVVIVAFTGTRCPVATAYEPRFRQLHEKFSSRGVEFVAINVGVGADEELDAMRARATDAGWKFPYLKDATHAAARAYGATVTPHLFVLDADRRIAYMGAFDDNLSAGEVQKHYLTDAVEALLAGERPSPRETLQRGCAIPYK